jgi:tetratricopeptide (TPR) repeat protein/tRNA A-37 threonylcarbamoyl transferase component Bud32
MHDQPDDDAAARQLSLNETELIAPEGSNDGSAPASIEPGSLIGSYKILNKIARGGMGVVYRAEQQYPVRRIVALKVIKPGMDSEHVIARFQAERQALAVMDHPNIARVFDAGTTSAGRLYFVMEMVDGLPITAYCQKHEVSLQDRLAPFISVCQAIQHAHQKGVIHRDIKPSNILVTVYDGKPVPKVIDFGIAKAMQEPLTDGSMRTQVGALVGTLEYMSPEQAGSFGEDIDTRSDVYALGAVLYELITSSTPLNRPTLTDSSVLDIVRRIREEDPPPPSNRLGNTKLSRTVRGDLDWVVMKALEKDRARRYSTPLDLAEDVRRYLRHEPVLARPASAGYRFGKYVRRHRFGMAAAAVIAALLIGSAVMEAVQLQVARRERDRATRERDRATRIADFMTQMFKVANPSEARGNSISAREILDKASQQIGAGLDSDPGVQAQLMDTMAQTYAGLGLYGRAQNLTERALAIQRSLHGERDRATLETESYLAQLIRAQGHLAEAETRLQATLQVQSQVLGPNDPDTLTSMDRLGYVYTNEARQAQAEGLFRQTLEAERRVLGPNNPQTLTTLNELAETLTPQGRYADADKIYAELIAAQRLSLGSDHPGTLLSMSHAAENLSEGGRYAEAEKLYAQVIAGQRRVVGPEHPQTLRAMTMLGVTMMKEGRYTEADKLQRQVIEIKRRVLGPTHTSTLQSMEFEALCLIREGRYGDGEKMFRDVIETAEKTKQPGTVAEAWYNFATAEAARGRADQAFADLDRAVVDGLVSPGYISDDPELKSLHSDVRFNSLVAKARETRAVRTTK